MIKSLEISSENSCLSKAADDEPLFVLRAQDKIAPSIVRHWAARAHNLDVSSEKINEALECAEAMERWQESHGAKTPD